MIIWSLKIQSCEIDVHNKLNKLFGFNSTSSDDSLWELKCIQDDNSEYVDYICWFVELVSSKYDELSKMRIKKEDITIWLLYEYEDQCNLEFTPEQLKIIGVNGIGLCVSCWEK